MTRARSPILARDSGRVATRRAVRGLGRDPERGLGRDAERGMTLLELLVAIAIFGLLAVAVSPVVTGALRSRSAATERIDIDAEARAVLDRLEQDLLGSFDTGANGQWPPRFVALPRESIDQRPRTVVELTTLVARGVTAVDGFVGGEAVAALASDRGDQAQVAWRIDRDGRLLRHELKPPRTEPVEWEREPYEVVSERADVVLEFWEPETWVDSWDSGPSGAARGRAPLAVRTTLAVGSPAGLRVDLVSTVVLPPVESALDPRRGGPPQGGGSPPRGNDGKAPR